METLTPEQMLTDTGWLWSLAFHLVRDADLADDVYQETMVAALQQRSSIRGGIRPWLSAVARKIASGSARRDVRRRNREREAARPEGQASTADLVERLAVQRSVAEALGELDEPYRSTVLLRYWEDLPPRRIAARMRVPVETVRTRLKRGLARLREKLDACAGGRRAWVAGLRPLARDPSPPRPWLRAVPWLALPAAGALAVVMPGWTAADPYGAPVTPPVYDRPFAWVRAYDVWGYPMDGLQLGLRGSALVEPVPVPELARGRGVYGLYLPDGAHEVEVRNPDLAAVLTSEVGRVAPGSDRWLVVAAPARRVTGMVVDAEGHPVSGAEVRFEVSEDLQGRFSDLCPMVRVPARRGRTDGGGRFAIDDLPTAPGTGLTITHPSFLPATVVFDGSRGLLTVRLQQR